MWSQVFAPMVLSLLLQFSSLSFGCTSYSISNIAEDLLVWRWCNHWWNHNAGPRISTPLTAIIATRWSVLFPHFWVFLMMSVLVSQNVLHCAAKHYKMHCVLQHRKVKRLKEGRQYIRSTALTWGKDTSGLCALFHKKGFQLFVSEHTAALSDPLRTASATTHFYLRDMHVSALYDHTFNQGTIWNAVCLK